MDSMFSVPDGHLITAPSAAAPDLLILKPSEKSHILLALVSRALTQMEISMIATGAEVIKAAGDADQALTLAKKLNDAWKEV